MSVCYTGLDGAALWGTWACAAVEGRCYAPPVRCLLAFYCEWETGGHFDSVASPFLADLLTVTPVVIITV